MTSVVGTFETCRRTLKMSAYRGRPEVGGARPRRVLWPPTDRRSLDALVRAISGRGCRRRGPADGPAMGDPQELWLFCSHTNEICVSIGETSETGKRIRLRAQDGGQWSDQ